MLTLKPPVKIQSTCFEFSEKVLNQCPNGLFRATFGEAQYYLPELNRLYLSAMHMLVDQGLDPNSYELDIKIHMLMPNQYPCIPNWHCDNVPRDANGNTQYGLIEGDDPFPMFIWLSGTPCTEFISREITVNEPQSHADISKMIKACSNAADPYEVSPLITHIDPNCWYSMDRKTPHRGAISTRNQWRVFCRLTHKSMMKERIQTSVVRRHSQVYLDSANFSW